MIVEELPPRTATRGAILGGIAKAPVRTIQAGL